MEVLPQLLLSLTVFSTLFLSSASNLSRNLHEAAALLSKGQFFSMGLTLDLIADTQVIPQSPFLTVFSPQDSAFSSSGQPSLSLLQFHLSPLSFSSHFLGSLPFGTEIPTTSPNRSLVATTLPSNSYVSLNGVKVTTTPLYSRGPLTVFGVDKFFNTSFRLPVPIQGLRTPDLKCLSLVKNRTMRLKRDNSFGMAARVMRSSGYSVMSSILGMQLLGIEYPQTLLTVFAPTNGAIKNNLMDFDQYPSMFLQHAVPCRLLWEDLLGFDKGTVIPTYRKGFRIRVTRFSDKLMFNKVPVTHPELYKGEWLVIHGISDVLGTKSRSQKGAAQSRKPGGTSEKSASTRQRIGVIAIAIALLIHLKVSAGVVNASA